MSELMDGATPFADLPLAPLERGWDAGAANARMKEFCGGGADLGKMDWGRFAKGHFWVDSSNADQMGGYKLPFADIVDGRMVAVWNGVHAALQRLGATQIPEADKTRVKANIRRYYGKAKKDFPTDSPEEQAADLRTALADCTDLTACEDVIEQARKLVADGCEEAQAVLADANSRYDVLAEEGRVELHDSFRAKAELLDSAEGKQPRVRVVFGQVDTKNENNRVYPKSEMIDSVASANRLAQRRRLFGLDGHPGVPGLSRTPGARDIALVWDAVMIHEKDLIGEAEVVTDTEAGRSYLACLRAGVELEYSKRGYGNEEHFDVAGNALADGEAVKASREAGTYSHHVVHDYILRAVDVVLDGADVTRTLSLTVDNHEPGAGSDPVDEGVTMPEPVVDIKTPEDTTPPPPPPPPPTPPEVDIADVTARVKAELGDMNAAAAGIAEGTAKAVIAAQKLEEHKAKLLASVTDEKMGAPIEAHLAAATSIEDADTRFALFAEALKARLTGDVPTGIGIVTNERHERQYQDSWYLGGQIMDRPESPQAVRQALIDSMPTNGKPGRNDPRNIWAEMVEAMWDCPQTRPFFTAATRAGARKVLEDAAATTTQLGTVTPIVLPLMRDIYPKLIPYELFSVQPMQGPSGVIHSLAMLTAVEEYNLSESAYFDSTYADHPEAASKKKIKPRFTQTTITARTKSLAYHFSQELRQDMRSVHGLDADQEMIGAATGEIARELNFTFLDDVRAGATAGSLTYGTQVPATPTYNTQEWNNRLGAFIGSASSKIMEKTNRPADWVVVGPGAGALLKAMNAGGIQFMDRIEFGSGLNFIGVLGGTIRVYEAAWFSRLKMLFGFRPPTWMETGAVYAPYIPLYVSPEDYDADTNTYKRSVSWRGTWVITNGDCFSLITASNVAGTDISDW